MIGVEGVPQRLQEFFMFFFQSRRDKFGVSLVVCRVLLLIVIESVGS